MPRLTAAQAILRFLGAQHTSIDGRLVPAIGGIWGIWGHGNVAAFSQALAEQGQALPFYQPKNEQSMVHAAMGYAKAMNRRATMACSASIGPGATNMLTGAATATVNRIPVLLFPSDYFAGRRPGNVLQQLEHPVDFDMSVNDAFRPLSRFFDRITRPEQIFASLPAAMRTLFDPAETGAVTISLPQDVQGEALEVPEDWLAPRTWYIDRAVPATRAVHEAADLLRQSRRPFVIAGGGVRYSEAAEALAVFCNRRGLPVSETHAGKGIASGANLCLGGQGISGSGAAEALAREADVVLCLGSRLSDFTTASRSAFGNPDARFILVNTNAADAAKLRGTSVVGDARATLDALDKALQDWRTPDDWQDRARLALDDWQARLAPDLDAPGSGPLTQSAIFAAVNRQTRAGDVVIAAAGTAPGEIKKIWNAGTGEDVFLEFGFSCMGHEIPAAIGARLARPDAGQVYALIGDGTWLMCPTEIVTAVQEGARITVVIIDNGGYQCIRDLQEQTTGLANLGNEFRAREPGALHPDGAYLSPDHAAMAAAMGAEVYRADSAETFRASLEGARTAAGPVVIVVSADRRAGSIGNDSWWDVGLADVSTTPGTAEARARHAAGRVAQRVLS